MNPDMLRNKFWNYLQHKIPRILGQFDRDPDSPTFGSFDRNYWHYKIRDFSSITLQQGILIIDLLRTLDQPGSLLCDHPLAEIWIEGSLEFWASEQLSDGSFNEYYPYEAGFPPTAFSLYAVALIFENRDYPQPDKKIGNAIQRACNWLLKHPEKEASNQEAACLAGLALASRIPGIDVDAKELEHRLAVFFSTQSREGWFPEYGGPDVGYLSVTIDCLWDYFDITKDSRATDAIDKAIWFIANMISVSRETPVMINARNTDYIVPYGVVRSAESNSMAAAVVNALFDTIDQPNHFLNRTDDRYTCHYVYQSCFRSLPHLQKTLKQPALLPLDNDQQCYFEDSGIAVRHVKQEKSIFINCRKGGIINIFTARGIKAVDFGWRVRLGKHKVAVTHWPDSSYNIAYNEESQETALEIHGIMTTHGWPKSSPARHMLLRISSFVLRSKLIPFLKHHMIFGKSKSHIKFQRRISIKNNVIRIDDIFSGANLTVRQFKRAPHYSLRHVASAGLFVPEELIDISKKTEDLKIVGEKLAATTAIECQ